MGSSLRGFLGWCFFSRVRRLVPGQQCLKSPRGRDLCPYRGSFGTPRLRAAEGEHRNMTEPDKISVYLLDDHEVVREGLRALLEGAGDITVVGESGSALEATHRIPALRPQVAVLDARLPDRSGIEVCRAGRAVDPSINELI